MNRDDVELFGSARVYTANASNCINYQKDVQVVNIRLAHSWCKTDSPFYCQWSGIATKETKYSQSSANWTRMSCTKYSANISYSMPVTKSETHLRLDLLTNYNPIGRGILLPNLKHVLSHNLCTMIDQPQKFINSSFDDVNTCGQVFKRSVYLYSLIENAKMSSS